MAEIGSLVVNMALDSASFISNMNKAAASVQTNASEMQKSLSAIQGGFSLAEKGVAGLIGALGVREIISFTEQTIAMAAEISHVSEAVGLTTAQFQQWQIAAEQVGVSQERFNTAIERFASNVGAARDGTGSLYTALKTLDPELLNQIRNATDTNQAMTLFLGALQKIPGASDQARLAVAGFGRGMQELSQIGGGNFTLAKMLEIPPAVIDGARQLQTSLDLVRTAIENGFATGLVVAFAGDLKTTDDQLVQVKFQAQQFGLIVGDSIKVAVDGFKELLTYIKPVDDALTEIDDTMRSWGQTTNDFFNVIATGSHNLPVLEFSKLQAAIGGSDDQLTEFQLGLKKLVEDYNASGAAQESFANGVAKTEQQLLLEKQALAELPAVIKATQSPMQAYEDQLTKLGILLKSGAISQDQFAQASLQAGAKALEPWLNVANEIGDSLSKAFGKQKAFALASAVIGAALGIIKAFELPFPLNWAQAAAVAAATAAQIATIESQNYGSSAGGSGASAKVASPAGGSSAAAATATPQQAIYVNLQGTSFGRDQIRGLIDQINSAAADGAYIRVN